MFPSEKDNPIEVFAKWFDEAKNSEVKDPTAMCLATADKNGAPSSRMVLLKGFDENGFVFFTNYESKKGSDLIENPKASINFYWPPIDKQVRINGDVEKVSEQESDEYFKSRDRRSQIGAHASKQSSELKGGMKELVAEVAKKTAKFGVGEVPRPEYWGGFRIKPQTIEFWYQGEFRIHKRLKFFKKGNGWEVKNLYP